MTSIRSALAALLVSLSLTATPALAASYSTDQSDLWWTNPPGSENGWGIQFVQRGGTIFATMFVYGAAGTPTWYVATMTPNPPGSFNWTGDLYATTGPYFGAVPYNAALFTATKVGTMTWSAATVASGTLSYNVNGVAVVKNLLRQTLVAENYSGHFAGGFHSDVTGCANPSLNGTTEYAAITNIVQAGAAMTVTISDSSGGVCTYNGTLSQFGQMGQINGNFTCTSGAAGSFAAFELEITEFSVIGRFSATSTIFAGCQASGWFGGLRVTTF
jgi:hypothetical protein